MAARFEDLASPHMESLYQFARHQTRSKSDAEDLVQEAFLRAFGHFHQFRPGTNFKAWMFRILRNVAINQYKRERVRGPVVDLESVSHRLEDPYRRGAAEPTHAFSRVDIESALARLPASHRMAALLAWVEGFTYEEIGRKLACPIGTVMSRVFRARRRLRRELLHPSSPEGRSSARAGKARRASRRPARAPRPRVAHPCRKVAKSAA